MFTTLLLVDGLADEVAAGGDHHSVDGRDAPLHKVGDHGAKDDTGDRGPVDLTGGR